MFWCCCSCQPLGRWRASTLHPLTAFGHPFLFVCVCVGSWDDRRRLFCLPCMQLYHACVTCVACYDMLLWVRCFAGRLYIHGVVCLFLFTGTSESRLVGCIIPMHDASMHACMHACVQRETPQSMLCVPSQNLAACCGQRAVLYLSYKSIMLLTYICCIFMAQVCPAAHILPPALCFVSC